MSRYLPIILLLLQDNLQIILDKMQIDGRTDTLEYCKDIDVLCEDIIKCLNTVTSQAIPTVKPNSNLKPFWSNDLKYLSQFALAANAKLSDILIFNIQLIAIVCVNTLKSRLLVSLCRYSCRYSMRS